MHKLYAMNGVVCACGKVHSFSAKIATGKGTITKIPVFMKQFQTKKAFLLSDCHTSLAAEEKVRDALSAEGYDFTGYCFPAENLEPDERSVGSAVMHWDDQCDCIIGVGSGVINDIGKILSHITGKPYIIVATAPSMDGYASATSSMTRDGLKISLPSRSADVIIGDTDILCSAPMHMMISGLGDMLAKYISICEWRISALLTGEYYCPEIAALIRQGVQRCVDAVPGLLQRQPEAVQTVFEGLVIGGIAMNYAGLSRPASGVEHYISHVLDMRSVEFGTPMELHGIQCAVGTYLAVSLYRKLSACIPNKVKALKYVADFDYDAWSKELQAFLGKGAQSMIALEQKEQKYDKQSHKDRLERIIIHWDQILEIIRQELPSLEQLGAIYDALGLPKTLQSIRIPESEFSMIFKTTKDIRDKYVLSRLAWDLGILDELTQ